LSPSLEKVLAVLLKIVIVLLVGTGIYLFVQYFWPLLASMFATGIKLFLPLFIAYLIAVLLNPVIDLFENKLYFARTPGTLVVLTVFLAIIGVLIYLLASNLIAELVDLTVMLSSLSDEWSLNSAMESLQGFLQRLHLPSNYIQNAWNEIWGSLDVVRGGIAGLLAQVFNLIAALPEYLILLVLMIIASFFFARDYEEIKTNMIVLAERWLNISLDTLDEEKYRQITRGGNLKQVWAGIKKVLSLGFEPVKINTVALRGFNEGEVVDFARLTREYPLHVRFLITGAVALPRKYP
jgi:predicted PurR-regulated permease PerM